VQGQGVEMGCKPRRPIRTHVASGRAILTFNDCIAQDPMRLQEIFAILGDVLPKANAPNGFVI
jgi:hypothetical protein